MRRASRIFFPTPKYVKIFQASKIPTFPCPTTYHYQRSRVLQQLLFEYLKCPCQITRVYYGKTQKRKILEDFKLPVVVMANRNVPETIHIAHDAAELERLIDAQHAVLVKEFINWNEKVLFVCVQYKIVAALHVDNQNASLARIKPISVDSSLLTNLTRITRQIIRAAQLDDILFEWAFANDRWYLMGMARPPVKCLSPKGIFNRHDYICSLIKSGEF